MSQPRTLFDPGHEPSDAPRSSADAGISTRRLGMRLFLLTLGILFTACILGIVVIRVRAEQWPPPGSPELPGGLWTATAILAVLSALLIMAVRSARASKASETSRLLAASTALGVAFLAAQTANWVRLASEGDEVQKTMLAFVFWMLTVLHALHVLGGLIPLSITPLRAAKGRYLNDPRPARWVRDR